MGSLRGDQDQAAGFWNTTCRQVLLQKLCDLTGFEVIEDRMVGQRRNNTWRQVVFQKPAA